MGESLESQGGETEAERAFLRLLGETLAPTPVEVEATCRARPELADELRSLAERHRTLVAQLDALGAHAAPPGPGAPGQRYEVRGEIARGGMGAILEVWDAELRRPLAMKMLRPARETGPLERLERERRRSRLLNEA